MIAVDIDQTAPTYRQVIESAAWEHWDILLLRSPVGGGYPTAPVNLYVCLCTWIYTSDPYGQH